MRCTYSLRDERFDNVFYTFSFIMGTIEGISRGHRTDYITSTSTYSDTAPPGADTDTAPPGADTDTAPLFKSIANYRN